MKIGKKNLVSLSKSFAMVMHDIQDVLVYEATTEKKEFNLKLMHYSLPDLIRNERTRRYSVLLVQLCECKLGPLIVPVVLLQTQLTPIGGHVGLDG